MLKIIVILIMCHLIGDYVLSSDYIQTTKGKNWYHLFIHSVLYCIPLAIIFGINSTLLFIFTAHFTIDSYKAKFKLINYATDQVLHYIVLIIYLI
jgi:type IV secretory pathway TrbL component